MSTLTASHEFPFPMPPYVHAILPYSILNKCSFQCYSKKVKRCVWRTFIALVASLASMTQDMFISLAPVTNNVSLQDSRSSDENFRRFLPCEIISKFTL